MASTAQGSTIHVNTTAPGINGDAFCSLQEAIYSANFDTNTFVDPAHPGDPAITTACASGKGSDTIALPDGAIFLFNNVASSIVDDPYNYMGPTATPIIFTKITIEGNGARMERPNPLRDFSGANFRAFAVGFASIFPNPGSPAVSGTGNLTLRNLYIKGFTARGGNGARGGGGGMGAGGAICVNGTLTVENSTFENNGARGGDGSSHVTSGPGGGGGGLSGNGGSAQGNNLFDLSGELIGTLGEGGGGGGAGSAGRTDWGDNGGTSESSPRCSPACSPATLIPISTRRPHGRLARRSRRPAPSPCPTSFGSPESPEPKSQPPSRGYRPRAFKRPHHGMAYSMVETNWNA
jgi:hypothetical protein